MSCSDYAKLGKYLNIMMPVTKDDLVKQQQQSSKENFKTCTAVQQNYCTTLNNSKCEINQNDEAICVIGQPQTYMNTIRAIPPNLASMLGVL